MRAYKNGKILDIEVDPVLQRQQKQENTKNLLMERTHPFSAEEVSTMFALQHIQDIQADDNTALRMKAFYPTFDSIVGQVVQQGFKFTHSDKLWRVVQPELTIQAHYPPCVGTESLYEEVCETHQGTLDDPIPYSGNMTLIEGKCYMQEYVIYLCIRSSGIALHHPLTELLGQYVEEV